MGLNDEERSVIVNLEIEKANNTYKKLSRKTFYGPAAFIMLIHQVLLALVLPSGIALVF